MRTAATARSTLSACPRRVRCTHGCRPHTPRARSSHVEQRFPPHHSHGPHPDASRRRPRRSSAAHRVATPSRRGVHAGRRSRVAPRTRSSRPRRLRRPHRPRRPGAAARQPLARARHRPGDHPAARPAPRASRRRHPLRDRGAPPPRRDQRDRRVRRELRRRLALRDRPPRARRRLDRAVRAQPPHDADRRHHGSVPAGHPHVRRRQHLRGREVPRPARGRGARQAGVPREGRPFAELRGSARERGGTRRPLPAGRPPRGRVHLRRRQPDGFGRTVAARDPRIARTHPRARGAPRDPVRDARPRRRTPRRVRRARADARRTRTQHPRGDRRGAAAPEDRDRAGPVRRRSRRDPRHPGHRHGRPTRRTLALPRRGRARCVLGHGRRRRAPARVRGIRADRRSPRSMRRPSRPPAAASLADAFRSPSPDRRATPPTWSHAECRCRRSPTATCS